MIPLKFYHAPASDNFANEDLLDDFGEQFLARISVCIDEQQPLAARLCCACISCAANLVHGFKHNRGTCRLRNFRRAIRRVVVADDKFRLQTNPHKYCARLVDSL